VQVPTRDGFLMEAMLVKPRGWRAGRRYPVVCFTYSGPHAPQVRDAYFNRNGLYHQALAQAGYLIWVCDNRSASGKGLASAKGVYKDLGTQELADLEDGLDWLVAEGSADPARIALWGWSYGGYMTAFALTHSRRFKLGIVGAPVTDWRMYDTIYTERFMDTPRRQGRLWLQRRNRRIR
jgi:dipeptidyl-peptidase-4